MRLEKAVDMCSKHKSAGADDAVSEGDARNGKERDKEF